MNLARAGLRISCDEVRPVPWERHPLVVLRTLQSSLLHSVSWHVMLLSPSSQAVRPSQDVSFIGRARAWIAAAVDSHGTPGLILTILTSAGRYRDVVAERYLSAKELRQMLTIS
jgi:hypothetical protein